MTTRGRGAFWDGDEGMGRDGVVEEAGERVYNDLGMENLDMNIVR